MVNPEPVDTSQPLSESAERPAEPIAVEEALPGLDAGVDGEELDEAVAKHDLDMGIFTDEELHWLADRTEVHADALEAPRLSAMPLEQQEASAEGALWVMMARGDIEVDEDEQVRARGRHGLLGLLREDPTGVARIEYGTREDGPSYAALYYLTANAIMVEMVNPAGLHHFLITTPTRAARLLLDMVIGGDIEGETTPGQQAANIDELDGYGELVEHANRSSLVVTGRASKSLEVEQASSTIYVVDAEVHLLTGWAGEFSGEVTLQRLGYDDVVAWAVWVVTDAMRPQGTAAATD